MYDTQCKWVNWLHIHQNLSIMITWVVILQGVWLVGHAYSYQDSLPALCIAINSYPKDMFSALYQGLFL